jgi:CRP-like cAMP-binding protein
MNALANQKNNDILRHFIPLNSLPKARFDEICNSVDIEECAKGTVLFEQGDEVKEFIYLISGMISLYAGEMEMETIVTGSESARFAIAHHIPRKVKAVTKSRTRIVRIATHKLDMASPKDEGQTYLVDEVDDQGGDWMTTMLQSPVFQRLPASNLQKVMMQMEEVAFEAGDVVVKQGDEADFYYIIKSGDCELIRQASDTARPVKLAELHNCDALW